MKSWRVPVVVAGMFLLAGAARAQTFGCRAAVSCSGPRGFSTQMGTSMGQYSAFSIGVSYNRVGGFRAQWNPPGFGLPDHTRKDVIDGAVDVFLARYPGLKKKEEASSVPKPPAAATPDAKKQEPAARPEG
jgi:hypothetical protein